jgi:hypothetical protein
MAWKQTVATYETIEHNFQVCCLTFRCDKLRSKDLGLALSSINMYGPLCEFNLIH